MYSLFLLKNVGSQVDFRYVYKFFVSSVKKRKKLSKKSKSKKHSKKNLPSTVPTKGALKGFDGIKDSEPKSDISTDLKVSQSSRASPEKKKKKNNKKRKSSTKHLSYLQKPSEEVKDTTTKQIDVYEFMDNDEPEMFQFRKSIRPEHFKASIIDMPSTSKANHFFVEVRKNSIHSNSSVSDVDDFVYMSDDYVCSADEHSLSEVVKTSKKTCNKKSKSSKRKDAFQKHAAMGKIFKNNAVRSKNKRKSSSSIESDKTNLDQLFDSLLEHDDTSSIILDETTLTKEEETTASTVSEETGVARQRARRKCTVGKQNVLAETWSSESETDVPSSGRPNSVESVESGAGRRRKSKRGQASRRSRPTVVKTDDDDSRVSNGTVRCIRKENNTSRSDVYRWHSSEDEHVPCDTTRTLFEQHGWIVGDSHKKLVTMLAHAKGRKRSEKRTFNE